jgi:hypothetical protein
MRIRSNVRRNRLATCYVFRGLGIALSVDVCGVFSCKAPWSMDAVRKLVGAALPEELRHLWPCWEYAGDGGEVLSAADAAA